MTICQSNTETKIVPPVYGNFYARQDRTDICERLNRLGHTLPWNVQILQDGLRNFKKPIANGTRHP